MSLTTIRERRMVEVWQLERRMALAKAGERSRVWRCTACGRLCGTDLAAPAPARCRVCGHGEFARMEDRRRSR
jgi:rubrerythrin